MAILPSRQAIICFADIKTQKYHKFDIRISNEDCRILAKDLDLISLTKLRLDGTLRASGKDNWNLKAHFGATVEQACVLTLDAVQTRIDAKVERNFVPLSKDGVYSSKFDAEIEMEQDETLDPLKKELNLKEVLIETLIIELPNYPRKSGVSFGNKIFVAPDISPLSDEDAKPFANLSSLMNKLNKDT